MELVRQSTAHPYMVLVRKDGSSRYAFVRDDADFERIDRLFDELNSGAQLRSTSDPPTSWS